MPTATPQSHYFSGDGLFWAARVAADGSAMGYRAVGNVSSLVLSPAINVLPRANFDFHTSVETNSIPLSIGGKLTANLESVNAENWAMLAGDNHITQAARANTVTVYGATGAYAKLPHVYILSVVSVMAGATALTAYVNSATPYDYRVDENGGLIYLNDGVVTPKVAGITGDHIALTVEYTHDSQIVVWGKATPATQWSFLFQGLNKVDGLLHNIRIPRAFIRAGFAFETINLELGSFPMEASLLFSPLDPDPQLFTIETLPQSYRSIN